MLLTIEYFKTLGNGVSIWKITVDMPNRNVLSRQTLINFKKSSEMRIVKLSTMQ
jgi:hypothetical protein